MPRASILAALTLTLTLVVALAGCVGERTVAVPPPGRVPVTREPVFAHAAVAADHETASEAGAEMLRRGGNAVDAAVATSFCLSVVRPFSCGIGGGGFMVIHDPGDPGDAARPARAIAINYREVAGSVTPDYYTDLDDRASRYGVHAVGVPGTVAGLLYALETYGTLDRATVLAPAIRAAERGFAVDHAHVEAVEDLVEDLGDGHGVLENLPVVWRELCRGGAVREGDVVRNPPQARALRLIATHGAQVFYHGEIADAIVTRMERDGGPVTREALAGYRVRVTAPLRRVFLGHDVLSMPPPSSGGIAMQQIVGLVERVAGDPSGLGHNTPDYVHLVVEAMKHAFADRAEWLADDAFTDVPIHHLLDSGYLDDLAAQISMSSTGDPYAYGSVTPAPDDAGTSHFSVVDGNGMAVACTETINLVWGSLVEVPGFGFCLNDEMDDFTTAPGQPNDFGLRQSDRNLPEPGKRPLSSMSPTIVLRDGRAVLVAGASGGPRIITGTLQCILNCMLFGMTPVEAVAAARFHHQWMPNRVRIEDRWADDGTREALRARGHEIEGIDAIGNVQLIHIGADGIRAACDPRKGGAPAGY